MAAVKASEVDRALKARRPEVGVLLFYGPDAGRVAERARAEAEKAADDPADPFGLVRIDGDRLAEEPGRLVEEATTFSLFGGRRVVWVRASGRAVHPSVAACLSVEGELGALVVIEAGDLAKNAPLRQLCEGSPRALALPCYGDEKADLAALMTSTLAADGLALDADARELLASHLGGDRLASRGELAKLALYARGRERVTVEDVEAVVSDVSAPGVDLAIDAAFAGNLAALEAELAPVLAGGGAGSVLPLALRHGLTLLARRAEMEEGRSLEDTMRSWRGLHFRRQKGANLQLRTWTVDGLRRAVGAIDAALLETRRHASLSVALTSDVLLRVARLAALSRPRGARG